MTEGYKFHLELKACQPVTLRLSLFETRQTHAREQTTLVSRRRCCGRHGSIPARCEKARKPRPAISRAAPAFCDHFIGACGFFNQLNTPQLRSNLCPTFDQAFRAFLKTMTPPRDLAPPKKIVDEKRFAS